MTAPAAPDTVVGWARRAPAHVVAGVLIALSVAWRASITGRGYLAVDDFPLISRADAAGLGPDYLLALYNNHFMPAAHLLTWVTHRLTGYEYWPYATLLIIGQAIVSVALYRLLVLMLPAGWAVLVPLCLFLFTPLTLEVSAWWAVGVNMLPMQLAMVLATGAFVRYADTGARRHLVTLGLAVALGLVFFEKSLLVVAFVFLLAVLLYAGGNPITAIRRWWPAWLVLAGISLVYLAAYLTASTSTLRRPASGDEVTTFLGQLFGHTVIPGLLGGPWTWLDGADGAALAAPTGPLRWAALAVFALFVGVTIRLRRTVAVRAWLLLLLYLALVAALLGATRLGSGFSGVAGAVPRYVAEIAVVAAICVGAALSGVRGASPAPVVARSPVWGYAAFAGVVLFLASALWSGVGFGNDWAVKAGRDYLTTARAELAAAPAGTVFMDLPVPEAVVPSLSTPYNTQSRFFAPLDHDPVFVTRARALSIFDEGGHIRPAWVNGVAATPGPEPGCGYKLTRGQADRISLTGRVVDYWHAARIAYISDRDTTGTFRLGDGTVTPFTVHRGLNAVFLLVRGGGTEVELAVADPAATVCTDEIAVGALVPAPSG